MTHNSENLRILVVDDSKEAVKVISNILRKEHYDVSFALSGKEALELLKFHEYDLILLDIKMPGMDGFEVFEKINRDERTKDIPVIFISQWDDTANIVKGLELGGRDYIAKDEDPVVLLARVKTHLELRLKHLELKQKNLALEQKNLELKQKNLELEQKNNELEKEKKKSEKFLLKTIHQKEEISEILSNILPSEVAEELIKYKKVKPYHFKKVSVLFADFKDFSKMTKKLNPDVMIKKLSTYFSEFDKIVRKWEVEKIKTIGDAYMCVGGLPGTNQSNPIQSVLSGLEIQQFIKYMNSRNKSNNDDLWELRIGVHTGDAIAGIVGKTKYSYDIWGDTINITSRMESEGEAGKVNISETTYKKVKKYFECTHRGKIEAKNIGKIDMYFVERIKPEYSEDESGVIPNKRFMDIIEELSQTNGI
jgi:DNA-binding response OmpR family regulator/class 3 adenylate cyclase